MMLKLPKNLRIYFKEKSHRLLLPVIPLLHEVDLQVGCDHLASNRMI